MSRNSPQSISPQRRSRSSDSHAFSDANIRNFAPVARIMKTALPENAKIAKEAKECMQECVSEFISFITSEGTVSRNFPNPFNFSYHFLTDSSLGKMSAREAEDSQRGGHFVRHDLSRF